MIDVFLETEGGEVIDKVVDSRNLLAGLVHRGGFGSTICLRFLDPYGDTSFNSMQIPVFVTELRAAREDADDATREHVDLIIALADRSAGASHLHLRFYGD